MSNTNIHMVCSVKGGSGKTAYALHKVVELAIKGKQVLYIDADVHASETCNLLYRRFDVNKLPADMPLNECYNIRFYELSTNQSSNNMPKHYLNSYMHPYKGYYSKAEEIMLSADLYGFTVKKPNPDETTETYQVSSERFLKKVKMIFTDPSKAGRAVFGNIFQTSGRSSIGVGAYIAKAKDLLKYVTKSNVFSDIVVDMPPGSDTFSDHLRELIIESSRGYNLSIYYLANDDIGHVRSSAIAACSHLHAMRSAFITRVCLVYNKVRIDSQKEKSPDNAEQVRERINTLFQNHPSFAHELDIPYYNSCKIDWVTNPDDYKMVVFNMAAGH